MLGLWDVITVPSASLHDVQEWPSRGSVGQKLDHMPGLVVQFATSWAGVRGHMFENLGFI